MARKRTWSSSQRSHYNRTIYDRKFHNNVVNAVIAFIVWTPIMLFKAFAWIFKQIGKLVVTVTSKKDKDADL